MKKWLHIVCSADNEFCEVADPQTKRRLAYSAQSIGQDLVWLSPSQKSIRLYCRPGLFAFQSNPLFREILHKQLPNLDILECTYLGYSDDAAYVGSMLLDTINASLESCRTEQNHLGIYLADKKSLDFYLSHSLGINFVQGGYIMIKGEDLEAIFAPEKERLERNAQTIRKVLAS